MTTRLEPAVQLGPQEAARYLVFIDGEHVAYVRNLRFGQGPDYRYWVANAVDPGPVGGYDPRPGTRIRGEGWESEHWFRRRDAVAAVEAWWRALIEASLASGDVDGGEA